MLRLDDLNKEMVQAICDEYQINVCTVETEDGDELEVWCWDSDLEELLDDSDIEVAGFVDEEKVFDYDDDYNPVGLDYGDYIRTAILIQDGEEYRVREYCVFNGVGAENALAIMSLND